MCKEAHPMRHAIGRNDSLVSKLKNAVAHSSDPLATDEVSTLATFTKSPQASQSDGLSAASLRQLLPTAKFFGCDDLHLAPIANSPATAVEGELVLYRVGECEPTQFIATALSRGAAGILTEQLLPCPLPQCIVGDVDLALATIAAEQQGRPDQKLLTIGVMGSAGKTTTALLIASLFRSSGFRTAYQTDLGQSDGVLQSAGHEVIAKPAAVIEWLGEAVDANCQAAIFEVSDDAIRAGVFDAIEFDLLVVTGADSQSRDYGPHALQCGLDRLASSGIVIASADDRRVLDVVAEHQARLLTFGLQRPGDVRVRIIEESGGMTTFAVSHAAITAVMESRLCGGMMAANHAAATAVGILIDLPLHDIAEVLGRVQDIPARQQRLECYPHATVVIDAGGNSQRVAETLQTMRRMKGAGRLWCVLTIDTDDDDQRLADYGNCLERFADHAIVTCREEGKAKFLRDSHAILDGVQKLAAMRLSADRQRAIRWAIASAKPQDTIVMIGGITRKNAHQQRSEIEQIVRWVESERSAAAVDDEDSQPKIFSIFQ